MSVIVGVTIGVSVFSPIEVGVAVGVNVADGVGVKVGETIPSPVGVGVRVNVGATVPVGNGVFVGVYDGVSVTVGVGVFSPTEVGVVGVTVTDDVDVKAGVEIPSSVGVGVNEGVIVEDGACVVLDVAVPLLGRAGVNANGGTKVSVDEIDGHIIPVSSVTVSDLVNLVTTGIVITPIIVANTVNTRAIVVIVRELNFFSKYIPTTVKINGIIAITSGLNCPMYDRMPTA